MPQYIKRGLKSGPKPQTIEQKFWKHVTPCGDDECWVWQGRAYSNGYGAITVSSRGHLLAHRVSYELHKGPIPDKQMICHKCDNPPCVNPAHLFAGTALENMQDMERKGRRARVGSLGENHPRHKVSESDVLEIRALWMQGIPQTEIAKRFGIVKQQVNNIVHRISWKHVI